MVGVVVVVVVGVVVAMTGLAGAPGFGQNRDMGTLDTLDTFNTRSELVADGTAYTIFDINKLPADFHVERLPYALRIVLENMLRHEDGVNVKAEDIEAVATRMSGHEISFSPERVLMQDFTGVPAVCDLAAMRDAIVRLGGDPQKINPHVPVELVIDHSVIVDYWTGDDPFERNMELEYKRNIERYKLLRYAQEAFDNFSVVPPGTGICHQVNLEYLARVVFSRQDSTGENLAYPDTLVGTDSHTTMVNGLGVLGWGVGGIEAEAAMLGQPLTMTIPPVVGVRLYGKLPAGITSTDLVLTITELLRSHGVVGKFVEYFGEGISSLPVETRATIANMSPEYGATCGIFPIDDETVKYLEITGRNDKQVRIVRAYAEHQGLFHSSDAISNAHDYPEVQGSSGKSAFDSVIYDELVELDLSSIEPSIAGPSRPQDRVSLSGAKASFMAALGREPSEGTSVDSTDLNDTHNDRHNGTYNITDGAVVIAAITSCTNTSNPYVLVAAGLLARKARQAGLVPKPWVKTSLAPGSRVVTDYLGRAGLDDDLSAIGFKLDGYGCTTCIGNSGPLVPGVSEAIKAGDLSACAVLSGNRNFEGRIHPDVRMNYLASPPLVVAYALAGTMNIDLTTEPIGTSSDGNDIFLRDIWPDDDEIVQTVRSSLSVESFVSRYGSVYEGDERWQSIEVSGSSTFDWDSNSTYVLEPPFFKDVGVDIPAPRPVELGHILAVFGDSVTTDHISPAGSIRPDSPAGKWLQDHGVSPLDFNSYGSRRGNHEVMMRGTFANTRIRNLMLPGVEGGFTLHIPTGQNATIYDAAMMYASDGDIPLIIVAGKEYGTGSSRDWAAKGPALLGIRAVVAMSFERIHRSNLVGMGILPLQLPEGKSPKDVGITGNEEVSIPDMDTLWHDPIPRTLGVRFGSDDLVVDCTVRLDTETEVKYFRNGGILQYVLRQMI